MNGVIDRLRDVGEHYVRLDDAVVDAVRHRAEEATSALPPLLPMAERVATVVAQGEHRRRQAGTGDSFWQYRRFEGRSSPEHRLAAIGEIWLACS